MSGSEIHCRKRAKAPRSQLAALSDRPNSSHFQQNFSIQKTKTHLIRHLAQHLDTEARGQRSELVWKSAPAAIG
jgi:hypothetical protein